jgi:lipopolysaccharide export system protein LptA
MWAFPHGSALGEQADRTQPVNIESDSMVADDTKKVATFEGKVVLTQGSLVIRADKLVVSQDSDGFQQGVATGTPATFRQKQDSQGEYVQGEARRIEYNGRVERVEFFNNARLRRDSGDDVRGDYISYDAKSERFTVRSGATAGSGPERRVRATIMPKKKDSPPAATPQPPDAPATGRTK